MALTLNQSTTPADPRARMTRAERRRFERERRNAKPVEAGNLSPALRDAGFELGVLKVVEDAAYKKAAKRSRTKVVYVTPEERANWHKLK